MRLQSIAFAGILHLLAIAPAVAQPQPAPPAAMSAEDFRTIVRRATGTVFPAVVYVRAMQENLSGGERVSGEASGSGVVISAAGEVVTNWHVIDKATRVRCLLSDGRAYEADVVGSDKDTDLALLRLKRGDQPVPTAGFGSTEGLQEGDFVMAMGAPWGLNRSVSIGIIACARRYLPEASEYSLWLQTDASISPGNSGGPLVDTRGLIVGINTRATTMGGDLGFAVPVETVREIVDELRAHGEVRWSWTGLQLQALRDFDKDTYFEGTCGVIVAGADPGSPARQAGFEPRDRILRVNGAELTALTAEDLPAARRALGQLPVGAASRFEILRSGEERVLELTPSQKGRVEGEELDCPRWDFTVKQINRFDTPDLHYFQPEGVFIFGVKTPGNAAASGLRARDILLQIDGKPVASLAEVKALHAEAMSAVAEKTRVLVNVIRGGQTRQLVLEYSRDYKRQ